jgi:hypothetical protein
LRRVTAALSLAIAACIPAGSSTPSGDAGTPTGAGQPATPSPQIRQSPNVMTSQFEDTFEREGGPASSPPAALASSADGASVTSEGGGGEAAAPGTSGLGPDWYQAQTSAWHIESGRLCGQNAHNHGVWLKRVLPINARIEFDAVGESTDGDLKAEAWGDGQSAATSLSYTNATSYLAILGGWKNTFHVLARINEHGGDRKQIKVDPDSDDPREKPATAGQIYHFKIERTDGKTVRWFVDNLEYLSFADSNPLAGIGHDHFGFNDWEVKVCFDNVKVTPLP